MEAKKEAHWYAFYVRMHHEKKTAEKLGMSGITHFLPIQEVVRQWSDRKKKIQQVVIPMLIFIRTDEKQRVELLQRMPSLTGCLIDPSTRRRPLSATKRWTASASCSTIPKTPYTSRANRWPPARPWKSSRAPSRAFRASLWNWADTPRSCSASTTWAMPW